MGSEGGYALGRPADEISLADVIRAVEGPIATVRGVRPDEVDYAGRRRRLSRPRLDRAPGVRCAACSRRRRSPTLVGALPRRPDASQAGCAAARRADRRLDRTARSAIGSDPDDLTPLELEQLEALARHLHGDRVAVRRATSSIRASKP